MKTPAISSGSGECPEAFVHGCPDGQGRCRWCGTKYTTAHSARMVAHRHVLTRLEAGWRMFYDPDWGLSDYDNLPD